jgi:hypothetical protein
MAHGRHMTGLTLICCLCIGVLGACAPEPEIAREADGVPQAALSMSPSPAADSSMTSAALSVAQTTEPESEHTGCQPDATQHAVQYEIEATLNWSSHSLHVDQTVMYRNDAGRPLDKIVFNVETNQAPGDFTLKRVANPDHYLIDDYSLESTRLSVPLETPLEAGCQVELALAYDLTLPAIQNGYQRGHLGYWGYSSRQVNLGMWFPMVAVFDSGGEWLTPPFHSVGEQFVLRAADFTVRLHIQDGPEDIRVAGPGAMTRPDAQTWQFELSGGRELALSISDQFKTLSTSTISGVDVELFYFADLSTNTLDAPRHALQTSADALTLYEELFGPCPYQRMVVVEGDFPDGMEFSGLVFVSQDWFRTWKGLPEDWLTLITAHEVAHQWWYALVGNDQGRYPYLDEALATYSEELYVEHYYPSDRNWWWDFRVNMYSPSGYVDTPPYAFQGWRDYVNTVYLRGALMMQSLRNDLGDTAFFAWLRNYAQQMAGQIAYPSDFWGILSANAYGATAHTRRLYLQQPDVLSRSDSIP